MEADDEAVNVVVKPIPDRRRSLAVAAPVVPNEATPPLVIVAALNRDTLPDDVVRDGGNASLPSLVDASARFVERFRAMVVMTALSFRLPEPNGSKMQSYDLSLAFRVATTWSDATTGSSFLLVDATSSCSLLVVATLLLDYCS